jgi:hypothetical protein
MLCFLIFLSIHPESSSLRSLARRSEREQWKYRSVFSEPDKEIFQRLALKLNFYF